MSSELFYESIGTPMKGRRLTKLKTFLGEAGISYDDGVEYTFLLEDSSGRYAATGSLQGNILKCIAVDDAFRGEGLSATVVTNLVTESYSHGNHHLFLFTKPGNKTMFGELGFYEISATKDVVLMENTKNGITNFVDNLDGAKASGNIGAIIANCNPFTNGHRYLIETAASKCDLLHLFIVSEDKSLFPAAVRFELAKRGVADLKNVMVHPTSDYLISSATFPTYFLKENQNGEEINCILDLTVFCDYFVPALHINKRFVGTEPFCGVTNHYNDMMKKVLPSRGVEVVELSRRALNGEAISASEVRRRMAADDIEAIRKLVPASTLDWISGEDGKKLMQKVVV